MKLAIIGSRNLCVNLEKYIDENVTEIVSGGAKGIDRQAQAYAVSHQLKFTAFLPEYQKFRKNAPLIRNKEIVNYADSVLAVWDGNSKGTKFTIDYAKKNGKPLRVIICRPLHNL